MRKLIHVATAMLLVSLTAACGGKKEVTELALAQAAQAYDSANMSNFLHKYPEAEKSLEKAVSLNPNNDDYWIELGIVRIRQGNKSGAASAYKSALAACEAELKKDPQNAGWLERKIRALVLLNRADDARKTLNKAVNAHPKNEAIRQMEKNKHVDTLLSDSLVQNFMVK